MAPPSPPLNIFVTALVIAKLLPLLVAATGAVQGLQLLLVAKVLDRLRSKYPAYDIVYINNKYYFYLYIYTIAIYL